MMTSLLWLDLETTGLDPQNDHILEVAWAFTPLQVPRLIPAISSKVITPNAETAQLLKANLFIQNMHGESGLLNDLYSVGTVVVEDAEDDILKGFDDLPHEEDVYLAGASVHFDKSFLATWMPRLHARLGHRIVDTSSTKMLLQGVHLAIEPGEKNENPHRAAHDIRWCIDYHHSVQAVMRIGVKAVNEALNSEKEGN